MHIKKSGDSIAVLVGWRRPTSIAKQSISLDVLLGDGAQVSFKGRYRTVITTFSLLALFVRLYSTKNRIHCVITGDKPVDIIQRPI